MAPTILYTACVLGALGLYFWVRPTGKFGCAYRTIGTILGLGGFGFLVVQSAAALGEPDTRPGIFFLLFSVIAIGSAVRMITHHRPVYSALYFVLVILASAALFLLEAEFMAFALIIVYAGAILITYMFVLMLAQQSADPHDPEGQPEYDLVPREPLAGTVVGFLLLALLSRMVIDGGGQLPAPPSVIEARRAAWQDLKQMPLRIERFAAESIEGPFELVREGDEHSPPRLIIAPDALVAGVMVTDAAGVQRGAMMPMEASPENVQRVGLALIAKFPVSLELAGIILLMAMFGAVILARRQIELTEDEKREAAGLRRLGHHDDPGALPGAGENA